MKYEMEELVPVVGKLAETYTAHESSSITYEKAEQLMGAVLYCIRELEEHSGYSLAMNEKIPAQRAYEIGAAYVEEKVKKTLDLYNKMMPEFYHYEKQCLYDTVVKGIPEFFKWYDVRFEPQNSILTLDYPVLKDISAYKGINRIYEFIKCICLEQKFLKPFPKEYVRDILSEYDPHWKTSIDNICETVFAYAAGHMLAGKPLTKSGLEEALEVLVKNYYESDRELLRYLSSAISGILVRLKNAADYNALESMI